MPFSNYTDAAHASRKRKASDLDDNANGDDVLESGPDVDEADDSHKAGGPPAYKRKRREDFEQITIPVLVDSVKHTTDIEYPVEFEMTRCLAFGLHFDRAIMLLSKALGLLGEKEIRSSLLRSRIIIARPIKGDEFMSHKDFKSTFDPLVALKIYMNMEALWLPNAHFRSKAITRGDIYRVNREDIKAALVFTDIFANPRSAAEEISKAMAFFQSVLVEKESRFEYSENETEAYHKWVSSIMGEAEQHMRRL